MKLFKTHTSGDGPTLIYINHRKYLVHIQLGDLKGLLLLDSDPAHALELLHDVLD